MNIERSIFFYTIPMIDIVLTSAMSSVTRVGHRGTLPQGP